MDLLLTADQTAIAEAVGAFLDDRHPAEDLRPGGRHPDFDAVWKGLTELGVFFLAVPEEYDGAGLGLVEEAIVFRELGRRLVSTQVLGTVLAARLCVLADEWSLLEQITTGGLRVALATEPSWPGGTAIGATVSGRVAVHTPDGADLVLVVGPKSAALIEPPSAPGVVDDIDPLAPVALFDLSAPAQVTAETGEIWTAANLLISAMLVGMSEASRDGSVGYVKTREQFGRPIGAFQAVKHRCAQMALRAETGYFQTMFAALTHASGAPLAGFQVSAARVVAEEAAVSNGTDDIQNHGAMGFTLEAEAHLYLQRALSLRSLAGSRDHHLEEIAEVEHVG